MANNDYPREEGDILVLGPDVIATKDYKVIAWKGQNYIVQTSYFNTRTSHVTKCVMWHAGHGEYYWDAKGGNNAIIFTSGEKLSHRKRIVEMLQREFPHAAIDIKDVHGALVETIPPVIS